MNQVMNQIIPDQSFYKCLLDSLFDAVFAVNAEGIIVYWNASCSRLTGYQLEEMLGQDFYKTPISREDKEAEHYAPYRKGLQIALESGMPGTWKGYIRRKNGQRLPIESHISPWRDESGSILGAIEIFRDSSAQIALEHSHMEALNISQRDSLTGLYSRAAITALLKAEMERSKRYHQPLSVVMIDLDHFKRINDQFGHDAGDKVLQQIGSMLLSNTREPDVAGRWGGEEFLLITPGSDAAAAVAMADRLRLFIEEINIAEIPARFSASFGAGQFQDNETRDSLLSRVDQCLYQAKEQGRNRVVVV